MGIRKFLRANPLVSALYYYLHLDDLRVLFGFPGYSRSVKRALDKFDVSASGGGNKHIISDIKKAYLQCKANPDEYFLLDLRNADAAKRASFITDKVMFITLGRSGGRKKHDNEIEDKWGFYCLARKYFNREVVRVSDEQDYVQFSEMALRVKRLICKPNDKALGTGIFAAEIKDEIDTRKLFQELLEKGKSWIIEERIVQDESMAVWNKTSVNTVRVLSFLNAEGFFIITPFLRTGRNGSVVDNAGAGGIFANVDYTTGIVESDGMDERGIYYMHHPDSKVQFKGWQVPQWQKLIETVRDIHTTVMPGHPYIGWDFALSKDRGWCVIEANWGQFVNQYIDKQGRKEEFLRYVTAKPYIG